MTLPSNPDTTTSVVSWLLLREQTESATASEKAFKRERELREEVQQAAVEERRQNEVLASELRASIVEGIIKNNRSYT